MAVIPYEKTDVVDLPWDGSQMKANLKSNDIKNFLKAYAWYNETATDNDKDGFPDAKSAWKFIHHMVDENGNAKEANVNACRNAIAFLNGAMNGTNIPIHEIQGVYNHVAQHLKDANIEPPTLKRSITVNDKETRTFHLNAEVRAVQSDDTQQTKIVGYAAKFNQQSVDLGFFETLDPHCFDNTDMSDVVALINHDENLVLGRTTSGTLTLKVDDIGLYFEVIPSNTSYANDLIENMKAGNINQCSFAFVVADGGDDWQYDDKTGIMTRTVFDIAKLYDVSIVTYPAYTQTEAVLAQRKAQNMKQEIEKQKEKELLKRKLEIELELV